MYSPSFDVLDQSTITNNFRMIIDNITSSNCITFIAFNSMNHTSFRIIAVNKTNMTAMIRSAIRPTEKHKITCLRTEIQFIRRQPISCITCNTTILTHTALISCISKPELIASDIPLNSSRSRRSIGNLIRSKTRMFSQPISKILTPFGSSKRIEIVRISTANFIEGNSLHSLNFISARSPHIIEILFHHIGSVTIPKSLVPGRIIALNNTNSIARPYAKIFTTSGLTNIYCAHINLAIPIAFLILIRIIRIGSARVRRNSIQDNFPFNSTVGRNMAYIQQIFKFIQTVPTKVTILSQTIVTLKRLDRCKSIGAKFTICTLRVVTQLSQFFLDKLNLRVVRCSILSKGTQPLMDLVKGNVTIVTITIDNNRHIFTPKKLLAILLLAS